MKVYPTHPSINIDVEIPNDWNEVLEFVNNYGGKNANK